MLVDRGLVISAGKMSGLWPGNLNVITLHDSTFSAPSALGSRLRRILRHMRQAARA